MLNMRQISLSQFFTFTFPIILGLGLGFLIARGDWLFAIVLAGLMPLVLLLSAWPFIGVILWLLLMPLSSALPNPELVYWGLHRLLLPVILCLTLLPRLAKAHEQARLKLGLPELFITVMVVYVPLSILINPVDTRQALIQYLDGIFLPFCLYLIIRLTILRPRELQILQWTALFVAASQCAISFLSFFAVQFLPYAWRPPRYGYASGSLLNPNVFASVLCFCLPLLFYAAMKVKSGFEKFIFIMASGVSLLFIFLSMERAAWLAGGIALLGLFVLYPRVVVSFSLVIGVFMAVIGGILFSKQMSMAVNRFRDQHSVDSRVIVTDAMLQMIKEKPIFGWGYETLNLYIRDYYRPVGGATVMRGLITSHNTFLTIFVELGLVGFMLYLLPVSWLVKASYPILRHDLRTNNIMVVIWLGAFGYFVINNFMDMRFFPIGLAFWWMELGLIANLIQQRTETPGVSFSHETA